MSKALETQAYLTLCLNHLQRPFNPPNVNGRPSCQLTKSVLPACPPDRGEWLLFPHVSECGLD